MVLTPTATESEIDLFSDEALTDPYPLYDELREVGPAVWLSRNEVYALTRDAEARAVLRDWEAFSSAHGVMLNDPVNTATGGVAVIASDPPRHEEMRRVMRRPLMRGALRELEATLKQEAEWLIDGLTERGSFDAVTDLAQHLPLTVISKLVGIPEAGRERMLAWAGAAFEAMGPPSARTQAALPLSMEMLQYGNTECVPANLQPGGWAQRVYDAAARGENAPELCPATMSGYIAPSLDTTINGLSSMMLLFGSHPDQWQILRADPSLVANAVNEVLRLESPIQRFTRYVTADTRVGETAVPQGARLMILYGAANRDGRRWRDPARFDIRRRRVAQHLAFGSGTHACVGSGLARMEIRAILEALVARVARFEIGEPQRALNQVLRGLASLQVTLKA